MKTNRTFIIAALCLTFASSKAAGHRIKLPNDGATFTESDSGMALNEWIDLIIEYKKGVIRISVNGQGETYRHEKVIMQNPNDRSGTRFTFKGGEGSRILFDSVQLRNCGGGGVKSLAKVTHFPQNSSSDEL